VKNTSSLRGRMTRLCFEGDVHCALAAALNRKTEQLTQALRLAKRGHLHSARTTMSSSFDLMIPYQTFSFGKLSVRYAQRMLYFLPGTMP